MIKLTGALRNYANASKNNLNAFQSEKCHTLGVTPSVPARDMSEQTSKPKKTQMTHTEFNADYYNCNDVTKGSTMGGHRPQLSLPILNSPPPTPKKKIPRFATAGAYGDDSGYKVI